MVCTPMYSFSAPKENYLELATSIYPIEALKEKYLYLNPSVMFCLLLVVQDY
jgi:hypothetical protein